MEDQHVIELQETVRQEYLKGLDPKADAISIHSMLLAEHILRTSGASQLSREEIIELQMYSDREFHNGGDDPVLDALWLQNVLFAEMVLRTVAGDIQHHLARFWQEVWRYAILVHLFMVERGISQEEAEEVVCGLC